jgi:hypothetical protein
MLGLKIGVFPLSKIIIGIHGLGNKPPKNVLENWWKLSLQEGLNTMGQPWQKFNFELVYWADILHKIPLDPAVIDEKSPFFIENPYIPGSSFSGDKPNFKRKKILDYVERQLDKIFLKQDLSINISKISDMIIHKYFKDLDSYYSATTVIENNIEVPSRELINARLINVLKKHQHKKIMLIAHSMGSIIAYDVLCHNISDIHINTFVTIGSPLGLSVVMQKILLEQKKEFDKNVRARTPENILRSWINFSDLDDKVAINYDLNDDFIDNSLNVLPLDRIVYNNYTYKGKRNPHKSYGYLRAPQLADVIVEYLIHDRNAFSLWFSKIFNIFKDRLKNIFGWQKKNHQ